jgi:predicted secreted protein
LGPVVYRPSRRRTPAADIVIRRYMEEGAKIARDITAHYAN